MDWHDAKLIFDSVTGLSRDALHVLAGVAGQVAAALIVRRPISSPAPWLVVLFAAAANEWADLQHELWPDRAVQWSESIKDVLLTLLLPTLLLCLTRWLPGLFGTRTPAGTTGPTCSGEPGDERPS